MAEYIDRDKVLEAILNLPPKMDEQGYGWLGRMGVWQMLSYFPAEDVQPVKHGRWIDGDCRCVTAVCSNCNRLRLGNGAKSAMRLALYCEKCGARMDGET